MPLDIQPQSEVARLLAQIEQENEAAYNGLHGLAQGISQHEFIGLHGLAQGISQHEFINARLEQIGKMNKELSHHVGPERAVALVVEVLNQYPDDHPQTDETHGLQ